MADDVLRFGKIEIIEWLRPGEMKTGRDLFDEVEPMGIASMPAIGAQYRQVWTRAEFLAGLREIENEFRATGMLPLLHIETHGSIGGIGVSEQEGIDLRGAHGGIHSSQPHVGSASHCGPCRM